MNIRIEMLRDGKWKEIQPPPVQVSATKDSGPVVTFSAGYIYPPWRVVDGTVLFERTT